ncbi:MAG: NUDIX domain-containing protein [Christensenellaceae bacterium]|jgi:8-oxo-dGTP diphosphatase|nr:NUDIX domain-containing protein [Christensenellaceae bacterium]
MNCTQVIVGCAVIVLDGNRVLLHKRGSKCRDGAETWCLAGGIVELGETFEQACIRETQEEYGIDIDKVEIICITNNTCYTNHSISIGAVARKWHGTPQIMEPHKCTELKWFDVNKLPEHMYIPSLHVIENFNAKRFYRGTF